MDKKSVFLACASCASAFLLVNYIKKRGKNSGSTRIMTRTSAKVQTGKKVRTPASIPPKKD